MQKNSKPLIAIGSLLSLAACAYGAPAAGPLSIPLKPDPPLAIDGQLDDWNMVPGQSVLDSGAHVTYGKDKWKNARDLSANVQLAWRPEGLFVAVAVTDDTFRQTQRGMNLWKGDHVELYLDTAPGSDPEQKIFGKRQFLIGLSPGNFSHTGDALIDIKPEAYLFLPAGVRAEGIQVASQQTAGGYTIEASIPWKIFDFKPQVGLPVALEVAVSDTDSQEASQGKMLTLGTATWQRNQRSRLLPGVLARADGSAPASLTNTPLFETKTLERGVSETLAFDAPEVPESYEAVLSLQARIDAKSMGGYTQALQLKLNGQTIDVKRLANKKPQEMMLDGRVLSMAAGNSFTVPMTPDYPTVLQNSKYAFKNAQAPLFEFQVGDLLKTSGNTLEVKNTPLHNADKTLVVTDAKLLYRVKSVPVVRQGPPIGALPRIAPQAVKPVDYKLAEEAGHAFALLLGGNTFPVVSQYSTPAGKWVNGSNAYFTVKRQLERRGEWVVVRDTFTNLTDENLPLMRREEVQMKVGRLWLGGLESGSVVGTSFSSSNPTVLGVQGNTGIGLLPLDDVFQVHIKNYSTGNAIGLADENLVLKPKSTYTAEWAIVPVPTAKYFDFVNATRRLLDVNFRIDGSFAFMRADPATIGKWDDRKTIDFVRFKDAKYLCLGPNYPRHQGLIAHGTQLQKMDLSGWKTAIARRHALLPDVKQTAYFHSFLDVWEEAPEKYHDSRLLLADGSQGDYGQSPYKLFVPTLTNSYGAAVAKNIDLILDGMKLDGVYWDEFERSRYDYSYDPAVWDGVSGDIDPRTMKLTRLKSSVTLLSLPWRLAQAKRIMERHVLITNGGAPYTRTMRSLRRPSFSETGSITNLRAVQLFTPIALGDHLTERSEEDAYRVMVNALNYGALYYWYNDMTVNPTHHTLTQYMFPFTPIELHQGYVIGQERIVTNKSGIFGWNDESGHEVHVYDETGREVVLKDIEAPTVVKTQTQNGKTWTEIRIGEGWSAAIVRKTTG